MGYSILKRFLTKGNIAKKYCWKAIGLALVLIVGACTEEPDIISLNPNAGQSFQDIENDGYWVQLNAVPVQENQTGTWRIYVGEHGHFDDAHHPRTKFYGEPGEHYELGWEVSQGDEYKASTITVSFKALSPEIIIALSDTLYGQVSQHLLSEPARFGATGRWELVSGQGGRIEDEQSHEAVFIGKAHSTYTVQWVLSYGSKNESQRLTFTTDHLVADAGPDALDIKTPKYDKDRYYTLNATLPAGGTANWEIIEGNPAHVHTLNNPSSLLQGVADTLYTLVWTVNVDDYMDVDTVQLRFRGKWGMWQDARDDQLYKFTEINGLEWMAENYNYALEPGIKSWYYGHAARSVIHDGYALESEEDRKRYGRLYNLVAADELAPEGWRLPSSGEFESMINSLGGLLYAKDKLIVGGETGLELNYPGYLEFSSPLDPAFRNVFQDQDQTGVFWTKDYNKETLNANAILLNNGGEQINLTVVQAMYYALPVRYVREIQD
jgi:uncharacterized protein (TIGR02145 family)